jgi:DNA replication licensing factor MCM6
LWCRYDRIKTLKATVVISAPITSRFDLYFVVLDEYNKVRRCYPSSSTFTSSSSRPMRRSLIADGVRRWESYRSLRQNDKLGRGQSAYRITVRQLESTVRLSEALAELHLESEVKEVRRTPCSFLGPTASGPV